MENTVDPHTLPARLDAEPDATRQQINHDTGQAETEAFGRRTRPFPNFYHTEVLVTSVGHGVLSSFSHSGGFVFGDKLHRHMDEVVDSDIKTLARIFSKWTGLKTAVLDHTIGRFQSEGQLFAFHSTGAIIGFRQHLPGILKKGVKGNEGIHQTIHRVLGNPDFWNDAIIKSDSGLKWNLGSIKIDDIAYSFENGIVKKVIDSTALETKNNHALTDSSKAPHEPGRPTSTLKLPSPSRDVK